MRAKTINGESWPPKTNANRAVPISAALRACLARNSVRPSDAGWFFPCPDAKHWEPNNFSHDLRAANQEVVLPWGCLDFRHTFGSQLAMKGESLYKIATLLGNSPEICRMHYAALLPEGMHDAVEFASSPSAVQLRMAQ